MPLQPQFAAFAKDAMAAIKEVTKKAGGPQTPEGKAASAMNALKHGLSGNTVAIPGENPAVYEQILFDLRTDHRPRTTSEDQCIEQMAMAYWKQVRAAKLETAIWDIETADATAEKSPFHKMAVSFLKDSSASKALDKTTRYQAEARRAYHQAAATLRKLQTYANEALQTDIKRAHFQENQIEAALLEINAHLRVLELKSLTKPAPETNFAPPAEAAREAA